MGLEVTLNGVDYTESAASSKFTFYDKAMVRISHLSPAGGPVLYSLPGVRTVHTAADAIEYPLADACGPPLVGHASITIELDASPAVMGAAIDDHKLLCFAKSVGTPFAVYQRKADAKGSLVYQTASSTGWTGTLAAPNVFRAVNETVRVTVVHDGHDVSIYCNGSLVANASAFIW